MFDSNGINLSITSLRESLTRREVEIELIQQTLYEVLTELDIDVVLRKVAERARSLVNAETLLIPMLADDMQSYYYRAGAGENADEIIGVEMPIDYGVCGWVFRHKQPWWHGVLEDLSEEERTRWEMNAGSLILVPLPGKERFLGGISAINKKGAKEFSRRDFNLLTMFAGIVSIAIENAMVVNKMEETEQLNDDYRRRLKILNKQLLESSKEIEFHALYDPLTTLPNRSLFRDRLNQNISQAASHGHKIGLLLIDLDRFKQVNDALGHDKGDSLLKDIATAFAVNIAPSETLARLGGDEFAVILPDTDVPAMMNKAENMLASIDHNFEIDNTIVTVGASIGATIYPDHGNTVTDMLSHADSAMYSAKKLKQGVILFDPAREHFPMGQLAMVTDLKMAIENNEFDLFYQPLIDLKTRQVTALEALGRWNHDRYGFVRPDVFINELEQLGLMDRYTSWAIESALNRARKLNAAGFKLKVSVNISVSDLLHQGFSETLSRIIGSKANGRLLTFEITENLFLSEYDRLYEILEYIRDLGITLSIDDFGTGYSSLSRLRKLPVSELKIDQSFIKDMATYQNDEVIVHSTIEMAHNLGLSVVAEGVERSKTLDQLHSLGCDTAQGYAISRPMSFADIEIYLDNDGLAAGQK